jgi:hypothetical protein
MDSSASTGLKRLNESVLMPGDIILTTTTGMLSKGIRLATQSDISHAMVYVEDRSVIDATGEGVHSRNTQRLIFADECSVHVLRLRTGISRSELDEVVLFMRAHVGVEYSSKEAVMTVLGGLRTWTKKQFCSRLVAQAFASAGITLVRSPNYCSPADIKDSAVLVAVDSATLSVSASEAALWDEILDIPKLTRDAINIILDGARRRDRLIQTFDDLHAHLITHPEDDLEFCQLLENSGYLALWRLEREKNPWQYEIGLLDAGSDESAEEYCWSVLKNEESGPNRYFINRGGYRLLTQQFDHKFFRVMLDLYERLAALNRLRVDVARGWLEAKDHLQPQRVTHLIPHTEEWFAALAKWDPPQAMMTKETIKRAGSLEVCSICGDEPAFDYYMPAPHCSAGGVGTLRLCEDCLRIRHGMGEPFVPLSHGGD